jgi:hypothetical protein
MSVTQAWHNLAEDVEFAQLQREKDQMQGALCGCGRQAQV